MRLPQFIASPYFILAVLVLLCVFDGRLFYRLDKLKVPGAAFYNVPQDIAMPTPNLLDAVYFRRVRALPNRHTMLILSNSIGDGTGSRDRLHFNKVLVSYGNNVINASLNGEHLRASAAFGLAGLREAVNAGVAARFDVFVIYDALRLYVTSEKSDLDPMIAFLCKKYRLSTYINGCQNLKVQDLVDRVRIDLTWIFFGNMRCILSPDYLSRWARQGAFWCDEVFKTKVTSPAFDDEPIRGASGPLDLTRINAHPEDFEVKTKTYKFMKIPNDSGHARDMLRFTDASTRVALAEAIFRYVDPVERFLSEQALAHSINFLFLGEPRVTTESLLTRSQAMAFAEGREAFSKVLRENRPLWRVYNLASFDDGDYYDFAHLREPGQDKLAKIMTYLSAEP